MVLHPCKICKKGFKRKCDYDTHMNGNTLCLKGINCKQLYIDHEKQKEDIAKLKEYNKALLAEIARFQDIETKYEMITEQMDKVLTTQKSINITNNNNNIIINNPVTFDNIEWDTSQLTYEIFNTDIPKSLTDIVKKQMMIDGEKGVYAYCCSDVSRNNYKMLTSDYKWKSDPGGLILFEKVMEKYFKPELEKILFEKFGDERPGSFTTDESLAYYVWGKFRDLFCAKDKLFKQFQEYMSKELYMSQEQRCQLKFKKNTAFEQLQATEPETITINRIEEQTNENN